MTNIQITSSEEGYQMTEKDYAEMMMQLGKLTNASETHSAMFPKIFEDLQTIVIALTENKVHAEGRDKALSEVKEAVDNLEHILNNGLKGEVVRCSRHIEILSKDMSAVKEFIDRRKRERIERNAKSKTGFRALCSIFAEGWRQFQRQSAVWLIGITLGITLWFVIWTAGKIAIFREGPIKLLKFLNLAGG